MARYIEYIAVALIFSSLLSALFASPQKREFRYHWERNIYLSHLAHIIITPYHESVLLHGRVRVPTRVYVDDSRLITVELRRGKQDIGNEKPPSRSQLMLIGFPTHHTLSGGDKIEVELIAGGCEISGDPIQTQVLGTEPSISQWSCYFPNSGVHEIVITIRCTIAGDLKFQLTRNEYRIRVVKLGPLTQREVWTLAAIATAIGGILALLKTLFEIGWLPFR